MTDSAQTNIPAPTQDTAAPAGELSPLALLIAAVTGGSGTALGIQLTQEGMAGDTIENLAGDVILQGLGVESREALFQNTLKIGTYVVIVIVLILIMVISVRKFIE